MPEATQESGSGTGLSQRAHQEPNPTSQQQSQHTFALARAPAFTVQQQAEEAAEQGEQLNKQSESFVSLFSTLR